MYGNVAKLWIQIGEGPVKKNDPLLNELTPEK
jgi:hypothetical protein